MQCRFVLCGIGISDINLSYKIETGWSSNLADKKSLKIELQKHVEIG
jgi:hypothetical protein